MRRGVLMACMGLGLAALGLPATLKLSVRLVYNPSDSVPRGWYRMSHIESAASLSVGRIVMARLADDVAALAAQRGYLPSGVPILKRIAAVAPQSVCVRDGVVSINGATVATVRTHDGQRRTMHVWAQCRQLADDELFLLSSTSPASFDSRYFGPIGRSAVLGIAKPLWSWSKL